jgi:hypothetical protein
MWQVVSNISISYEVVLDGAMVAGEASYVCGCTPRPNTQHEPSGRILQPRAKEAAARETSRSGCPVSLSLETFPRFPGNVHQIQKGALSAFIGRQVHFDVDGDDFYLVLLFFMSNNCYRFGRLETAIRRPPLRTGCLSS